MTKAEIQNRLDEVLTENDVLPEELFDEEVLNSWAEENGWVKTVDTEEEESEAGDPVAASEGGGAE